MGDKVMLNRAIEIVSGPDDRGRYTYFSTYDDPSPPWCGKCGGTVAVSEAGITCVGYPSGSTPERRAGCGFLGLTVRCGQIFHAPLPEGVHA